MTRKAYRLTGGMAHFYMLREVTPHERTAGLAQNVAKQKPKSRIIPTGILREEGIRT